MENYYELLQDIARSGFQGNWHDTWLLTMKAEIQYLEDTGVNAAEILCWVKDKIEEEVGREVTGVG